MHTTKCKNKNLGKHHKTLAYGTPSLGWDPGPGLPEPRPWRCCRLAYIAFPLDVFNFWYAYALIRLEMNTRLGLN